MKGYHLSVQVLIFDVSYSPVMNTIATSFPAAALAAALRSVSLVEEEIFVPAAEAFAVSASNGCVLKDVHMSVMNEGRKWTLTATRYGKFAVPLPHPMDN